RLTHPNREARLTQHDFVTRTKPNSSCALRNRNRPAITHDSSAVAAAVVVKAIAPHSGVVSDVRVPARHRTVNLARVFLEHDMIGSQQPVAIVSDLGAAAEIDSRRIQ